MMKDQDKINININIGGEDISLTVPFQDQELTREIEDEINALYRQWRHSFPNRSDKKLMAMMVYQYASHYRDLKRKYLDAVKLAMECLGDIDEILDED